MKRAKAKISCLLFFFTLWTSVYATDPYSKNIGFETGTFTGWTGYTWLYYGTDNGAVGTKTPEVQVTLPNSRRQVIMKDTTAYDANTGGALKEVPKGYKYSARLGDEIISSDGKPRGWEQSLKYNLKVDSTNALLVMKFACVLQYASDHTALMEPRFRLTLYNASGTAINDCANYDVYSSSGNVSGFQTYTPSGSSTPNKWRDWTTVGADLSKYIGQTITIEFMAADCNGQYHYGYAYFVAETHPMYITVKYCTGDTSATLTAPEGFSTYSWVDSAGTVVGISQTLILTSPVEGATYICNLTSATGCKVSLTSVIAKYEPNADFNYELVNCNKLTNTMKFTNLHPATHGTLEYKWYFGDGTTSTERNPSHDYTTSGMHQVSLMVHNPPSLCTDSVSKMVETFYPPLIGISGDSTYCPGSTTTLKAYGAYRYKWSNGSKTESIEVGKDTTVWMIGYSSVGCYTDTLRYKVKEEPDWTFTAEGKELFCQGDSSILTASGVTAYKWSSGQTTSSITVKNSGTYTVTGTNARGCEKYKTFNVVKDPLPSVDFTLSTSAISSRHNQLTYSIPQQDGVQYIWDMGDGTKETGSTNEYNYNISSGILGYTISLTATNQNGCINTASKDIDVIPFVPNVFTPNGDGVNDIYMQGLDMQIFDRYGLRLYNGITGWDGTFNGKKMDQDTYFYVIHYNDKNKKAHILKGYVMLMK